jgi:2-polyprenyl-6-methoxyphenol hydroxylase-like FAD-dependent oxidoreductase
VELLVPTDGAPIGQAEAVRRIAPYLPRDASVERVATYVFADRSARRWREGRVLLAGDAAHTMPPFAGQGFAAGVRDVTNLAWKLDLVVRGLATPGLLETYEAERRAHLSAMTRLTRLAGSLVTPTGPVPATLRDGGLRAAGRLEASLTEEWSHRWCPAPAVAVHWSGRRWCRPAQGTGAWTRCAAPASRCSGSASTRWLSQTPTRVRRGSVSGSRP